MTLLEMASFTALFGLALLAFGMPLSMLNLNRDADNILIESSSGSWILDIVYNQYLLSLGEFATMDNFNAEQSQLVLLFFVMATIYTQITMLNMIIAIVGDSFDRAMENKVLFDTEPRL